MAMEPLKLAQVLSKGAIKPASAGAGVPSVDTAAGGFADKLASLVDNVEDTSAKANQAVTNMLNKTGDVHDAMIVVPRLAREEPNSTVVCLEPRAAPVVAG